MRVPRSPASTLKDLDGKASPGGASELLLPNVSEGELSPVVVKKVLHSVGLQEEERRDGQDKADGGREDEEGKGRLDSASGLGLDVRSTIEDEAEGGESVLVRPPTPTEVQVEKGLEHGQEAFRGDKIQTDFIRAGQALTEEPEANINLGAPIASANPRNAVSPTPTLGDELDTDARYGIDAMADDMVGKQDGGYTGDLADDALAGWTGAKAPAVHATVDETPYTNEVPPEDKEKKMGFEPIKGKQGEPSVHLGEWEPVDFKAQFEDAGKEENKGTDDALRALGDKLAQEEAAGVEVKDAQKEEEEVKLDLTVDELKVSSGRTAADDKCLTRCCYSAGSITESSGAKSRGQYAVSRRRAGLGWCHRGIQGSVEPLAHHLVHTTTRANSSTVASSAGAGAIGCDGVD